MTLFRALLGAAAALFIAMPAFATDDSSSTSIDTSLSQSTEQTKVDLNKATPKQLMSIKGISASKARAIVTYRKKHGDFKSVDDLAQVKGFKNLKLQQLKDIQDQLSVE